MHDLMAQLAGLQDVTEATAERVALETARQLLSGTSLSGVADAYVAALSTEYDLFVNATYMSVVVPHSAHAA